EDEHSFLLELKEAEIPVIAPISLISGSTLGTCDDTFFAIYPKMGGRNCDEFTEDQWLELGRLIGRIHSVGAESVAKDRIILTPEHSTKKHIDFIIKGGFLPKEYSNWFVEITDELLETITPLFKDKRVIRIHGDCYSANIIHRPQESLYMIDFDDMVMGPAIHDVWMLLPGYIKDTKKELSLFVEGYETFKNFNFNDLSLVEPLRAMRYVHFAAWCAHRAKDGGAASLIPGWGSPEYWQIEINDLESQIHQIKEDIK
ncbi:MAG: serine/threonine protein kinase, partial [Candidatus Omnitrophica bacterium]|nr:serine/threonine protein kinase [Candidatus Omnitrophota bacterium]